MAIRRRAFSFIWLNPSSVGFKNRAKRRSQRSSIRRLFRSGRTCGGNVAGRDRPHPLHIKSHFNVSSIKSSQYLNAIVVDDCGLQRVRRLAFGKTVREGFFSTPRAFRSKLLTLVLFSPKGEASKAGRLLHFSKPTVKEPYLSTRCVIVRPNYCWVHSGRGRRRAKCLSSVYVRF